MLSNFLEALKITGAASKLKRIILTTGCKQYGVHLGPVKVPMEESDPWLREGECRPPNFYYVQQDILHSFCKENDIEWVVTYPNDVIGFANGNFMNLTTSLALYALVMKEMGKELYFPGGETFYTKWDSFTYSKLHADFNLWAALEPKAANQAFNVVNGEPESWQTLWPQVAERFGVKIPAKQFEGSQVGDFEPGTMKLQAKPPIDDFFAPATGLVGKTRAGLVESRVDLVKWSKRSDVKAAWDKLATREGLQKEAFEKATWGFLSFVLGRNFDIVISMRKARKAGWTGYQDTWDSLEESFGELADAKIIPK